MLPLELAGAAVCVWLAATQRARRWRLLFPLAGAVFVAAGVWRVLTEGPVEA